MLKRMHHVGLTPPRGDYWGENGDNPYSTTSNNPNILGILYGAFSLDSHINFRLEISGNRWEFIDRENSYILPNGPIMLSNVRIASENPRKLSWTLAQTFQETYRRNHITSGDMLQKRDMFIKKQLNLVKIFEKLLIRQILADPNIPREKAYSLFYSFVSQIRAGLTMVNSRNKLSILNQFNTFLDSNIATGYITFKNGYQFRVSITDFQGEDIMRWVGTTTTRFFENFPTFKREQFINPFSKDFHEFISSLILDVGGEVEIFPLWYASGGQGYKGNVNGGKDMIPNKISLDLQSSDSVHALDYMANLMIAYPVLFVVSEKGSTWNDNKVIFAFNQQGFVKIEDIYSIMLPKNNVGRLFSQPVTLLAKFPDPNNPGQFITFYDTFPDPISSILMSFCEKYNELWKFPPLALLSGSHSEFQTYFDRIKVGITRYDIAIREIFE